MSKRIGYDFDDLFDLIGLARRRSAIRLVLPALGLIALGAALGAAAGLMLAPASGRRMRRDMGERFEQVREKMKKNEVNATAQS